MKKYKKLRGYSFNQRFNGKHLITAYIKEVEKAEITVVKNSYVCAGLFEK